MKTPDWFGAFFWYAGLASMLTIYVIPALNKPIVRHVGSDMAQLMPTANLAEQWNTLAQPNRDTGNDQLIDQTGFKKRLTITVLR